MFAFFRQRRQEAMETSWPEDFREGFNDKYGGTIVALSRDAETIAVGAPYNDESGGNSGRVRVYSYCSKNDNWNHLGQDTFGRAASDQFGASVDISSDGRRVAAGALYTNSGKGVNSLSGGYVRVSMMKPSCGYKKAKISKEKLQMIYSALRLPTLGTAEWLQRAFHERMETARPQVMSVFFPKIMKTCNGTSWPRHRSFWRVRCLLLGRQNCCGSWES